MSNCTVIVSPEEQKEGKIHYYDIDTNRVFVELDGHYSWYPRSKIICNSDILKCPGIQTSILDKDMTIKKNDTINSDTILTLIQRVEFELLHPDVQKDMRRLEYEYYILSKRLSKKRSQDERAIQELEIPSSSCYYPYKQPKYHYDYSFKTISQKISNDSQLTSRQELLCWAYNHTHTWAKTFPTSRSQHKLRDDLHINESFVKKNEKELYTLAFGLDEYGYYSLYPHLLLQDLLSRVHNYTVYQRYSCPPDSKPGLARVYIHHHEYVIRSPEFRVGAIAELTYDNLKQINPALEKVVEKVGGCDVSIVDGTLPSKVLVFFWCSERRQWAVRSASPQIHYWVNEKEKTLEDGDVLLGNEGIIRINNNNILLLCLLKSYKMSDPYANVIVGKLSLKGGVLKKKSKKSHKKKEKAVETPEVEWVPIEEMESAPTDTQSGTGRIYCTGTVVYGKNTRFLTELAHGDVIVIQHPQTFETEMRVVKVVASDTSLSLSSPFSTDFSSEINFEYYKKPEEYVSPEEKKAKENEERDKMEDAAFGIYKGSGGTEFTYKVRQQSAYGGWKTITKKTKRPLTREEMLDMRVKNKSDRHCM